MEGTRPIYDLDSLLNNEDDVAFIIVRETYCSKGALSLSHTPLSEVWYENIWLKSMPLRSALTSTACCYINNPSRSQYETTTTNKTSLVATREIDSPYLFLYHHRDRLGEYTANHPDALSHIRALLNYANDVYGADYREADELLSKGLVTNRHLIKLFVPNELVFTYTDGEPTAYVVRQWPTKNKDGSLRLECWSWKSNGSKFVRHTTFLRVATTIFDEEQIEIQRLHVSPLIYQSPETRSNLELRGEKHWSLGSQKYVSYTGWNTSHDQYYASRLESS